MDRIKEFFGDKGSDPVEVCSIRDTNLTKAELLSALRVAVAAYELRISGLQGRGGAIKIAKLTQ